MVQWTKPNRWLEEHPAGFFERRSAFSARGKYGKWIRKGSAIVRHGNILYLHGGLSEEITNPVAKLNERIRHELKLFDNYVDYLTRRDVILPFFRLGADDGCCSAGSRLLGECE